MGESRNRSAEGGRLPEVEALRAIAFVFIVFSQAGAVLYDIPHTAETMGVFSVLLSLARPAMPMFMFITGLLLARRTVARGSAALRGQEFIHLLSTYVAWTIIYVVMTPLLTSQGPTYVLDLLRTTLAALWNANGMYHLWYLVIAAQIHLVTPPLAHALDQVSQRSRLAVVFFSTLITIVLLGQIGGTLATAGPPLSTVFATGSDKFVFFWLAYVVAGATTGVAYEQLTAWLRAHRVAVLLTYIISAAAVAVIAWQRTIAVGGDYSLSVDISKVMQPWIVPFQLIAIYGLLAVSTWLVGTRAADRLVFLGSVSFGGYLAHPLALMALRQYMFTTMPQPPAVITVIALSVLTLAISVLISWGLGRLSTPLGTVLAGVSYDYEESGTSERT